MLDHQRAHSIDRAGLQKMYVPKINGVLPRCSMSNVIPFLMGDTRSEWSKIFSQC